MSRIASPSPSAAPGGDRFFSVSDGRTLVSRREGETLVVESDDASRSVWGLRTQGATASLSARDVAGGARHPHLAAAVEAAFAFEPTWASLALDVTGPVPPERLRAGLVRLDGEASAVIDRAMFFQQPGLWAATGPAYPVRHILTQGRRHPLRPPKPAGTVYRRHAPWLSGAIGLRVVDAERDLPAFHRWMNDPAVDRFWDERGDEAKHRRYLEAVAQDPHVLPLVLCLDDRPFGYVEAYWAREDRIAPFCDARDHDRGWHVLVGEAACRGKPFVTAWMPSVAHYLFLDDERTQRIVIEPRIDNERMLRSLARNGYALVKEFDFPHKRAMLGVLLRERFFGEALWIPRGESVAASA